MSLPLYNYIGITIQESAICHMAGQAVEVLWAGVQKQGGRRQGGQGGYGLPTFLSHE